MRKVLKWFRRAAKLRLQREAESIVPPNSPVKESGYAENAMSLSPRNFADAAAASAGAKLLLVAHSRSGSS